MDYRLPFSHRVFLQEYDSPAWNLCSYCLLRVPVSFDALECALNEVVRKNDALRISVDNDGDLVFMEYAPRSFDRVVFPDEPSFLSWAHEKANEPVVDHPGMWTAYLIEINGAIGVFNIGHHIMCDALNVSNLYQKVIDELHSADGNFESYASYLESNEKYLQSRQHERDRAYWDRIISDGLPRVFPHRAIGECENFTITLSSVKEFCADHGLSEAAFLYAATGLLLLRLQALDSLTLGIPVLGRTTQREMAALGLFMHDVPMVVHGDDKSFLELVQGIENNVFDLFRHQRYDFPQPVLFDVSVDYSEYPKADDYEAHVIYNSYVSTAMEFHFLQRENLELTLRIQKGLFRSNSAVIASLEKLIQSVLTAPDLSIWELPIAELGQSGNSTDIPSVGLYSLIENQRAGTIIEGDHRYSLADLRHDAEKIDITVRREKRVIGVLCDRSYLELAAIYGIVRGGNAYLPISPDYPQERIKLMLEQSGCDTILAQAKYRSLIEGSLCIEDILADPAPYAIPPASSVPDDILYVIFTSGSTGTPKGAAVSNRSAVNRILWMCRKYFTLDTVVMLKTPYTFDVSVWEIFGFAIGGFTLYVLPPEDHYRQDKVIAHIRKGNVTDLHFVPSVFRYFLDVLKKDGEPLPSLKSFFLSGEALSASLVNEAPSPVHNLYGPTECAVDVSFYDCADTESDPVPIGAPIDNCQIYVLDKHMQPLPAGVVGQVCIGGVPVGKGYVNAAEKTKSVFVPNPFKAGNLYLTGDLGYWNDDGKLIFVGRNDQQVKINGQRVELGEIETALGAIVPACAVIYENNRLVAYYTGNERNDLRKRLLYTLPRHMVPHSFIHIDALPLTTSGKVDRQALRSAPHLDSAAFVTPSTSEEQLLIEIVKAVLSLSSVSIDDNYYELGGDSLSSLFVITQLQDHGYELSISDLLKSDTLADAAGKMRETTMTAHLVTSSVTELPPVIKAYLHEKPDDSASFAQTCVIPIDADESAVRRALYEVISRHEMLRANFSEDSFSIGNASFRFRSEAGSITYEPVSFDLENGPLVDAVHYPGQLKLTIHHFVVDAVSWTIIIDELRTALRGGDLPQGTASYREFAQTPRSERIPFLSDSYLPLFTAGNSINHEERYSFSADPVPNEVLLTALGLAANELAGGKAGICVETHGRTDARYSRTVGWFTAFYPFSTESLEETKAAISALSHEREDYLSMFDHLPEGTSVLYNYIPILDDVVLGPLPLFPGKLNVNCIQQQDNVLIEIGISSGHHPMGIAEQLGIAFQRHIESLRAAVPSDHSSFATDDAYELTPTQVGMYHNWSAYYLKYVIRLEESLDIDRLKNALHLLAEKHPVLKSKFVEQCDGAIKQLILRQSDPYIQGTGIRHGDSNSLFRVTLDGDRLIIDTHHIILDGWSLSILARDLKFYYDNPQAVARTTPSFGLYSSWLKQRPNGITYWKDLLSDCGVSSDLPHVGNASSHFHTIMERLVTVDSIDAFARIHRVTINTVLETAFAMLLLHENSSAIYGKMLSGRNAPITGIQDIVGPFVNMVPVFVKAGSSLLSQIHEQSIMANEYSYVSLAELYSHTDLKRINILFVFENYPLATAVDLVEYRDENEFDLTVTVRKTDTGYLIRASYSPDKYTTAVIDRALAGFENSLRQLLRGDEKVTYLMSEPNYVAPVGTTEATICRQFEEVIGIERVSRFDNFFDLGGTSLNVMELLRQTPLDVLSPSAFMNNPTPVGLAKALSKLSAKSNITGLYTPEHATRAYVLFPYGGGDAAAYTALVAEFRRRVAPVALYFVPWGCDYNTVAEELSSFRIPLRFYSHCAGAVIALKLLDRLDCVEKFFAGANIPPEDASNIWTSVPDEILLSVLHQAGMPVMPEEQNRIMLQQFRNNTKEYFEYLQTKKEKTPSGVSLVLSRYDLFTQSYTEATPLWERIVIEVDSVQYIDSPTHYFQSSHAASLADILLEV